MNEKCYFEHVKRFPFSLESRRDSNKAFSWMSLIDNTRPRMGKWSKTFDPFIAYFSLIHANVYNEPFLLGSPVQSLSIVGSMNSAEMDEHDQFIWVRVRDFRRCQCLKPCLSLILWQILFKYALMFKVLSMAVHLYRNGLIREIIFNLEETDGS